MTRTALIATASGTALALLVLGSPGASRPQGSSSAELAAEAANGPSLGSQIDLEAAPPLSRDDALAMAGVASVVVDAEDQDSNFEIRR